MYRTVAALVVFCIAIGQINAQCVPRPVVNVGINENSTLVWQTAVNDSCGVDHFIINVQYAFGQLEDTFITTVPFLDVSGLPLCQYWVFSITPVSLDYVTGGIHHLLSKIPMPPGTNLSVSIVNITDTEEYLYVEWSLTNTTNSRCADSFRLTVLNEQTNELREVEVVTNFALLLDVAACGSYIISIRAIHDGLPQTEGQINTFRQVQAPRRLFAPRLLNVTNGATFFSTYLQFEPSTRNRCTINTVYVNGSPNFNLTLPVVDSPSRQPFLVNVTSLRPNVMYVFSITVQNTAGISLPLRTAIQTLPLS